jgi:hypothetical protein
MKKFAIGLFCLALVVVFCHLNSQTDRPVWKGKIVIEDGVRVVKNPSTPLYGEFAFDLQKDLMIGGDPDKENYYFPKGGLLSIDDEGNLFFTDLGNKRVQMYDKSGQYIRTIGRQGQGPGEYVFPGQVYFDPEGNTCVRNGGIELNIYGKSGTFLKKVTFRTFVSAFILGPNGSIIGTKQPGFDPGGPKHSLIQLNKDGSFFRTISEFRGELSEGQKAYVLHWYSPLFSFSPLTSERFCYGFSDEYKIHLADSDGKTMSIITRDEKYQAISGEEKAETRKSGVFMWSGQTQKPEELIVFPDHRPFFRSILNDDERRFYIVRFKSILEKDAPSAVDVFSEDGIYLYRMTWAFIPAAIKHGCLDEVRTEEETGEVRIIRYRIRNWARMAAG